jgi:RNA 3'-terminal phosphate cyclase (ATP)
VSSKASSPGKRPDPVLIDGARGEGGGQILRTALTLSLLTGRPFRMIKVRANRDRPGLRPQHKAALDAAALLGNAEVTGGAMGARELTFSPGPYNPRDLNVEIGTAGSSGLVLQTLHLPCALRAEAPVHLILRGGTFNPRAPAFPFLEKTWCAHLRAFGMRLRIGMPRAGFYPRGGGQIEAWIEPGSPRSYICTERGPLRQISGTAGVSNLRDDIARRLRDHALKRLDADGLTADIELVRWPGPGQGAALILTAENEGAAPATFVGLGARGKPSEAVADEAVNDLLAFQAVEIAAVDAYSADQILLPLACAAGSSTFTVSHISDHLRANAETIAVFLDRVIRIEEGQARNQAGRVVVE